MTRPDIKSDARRVASALRGGGVAIIQGDVGYGMLATTPDAARRTISMKHRARNAGGVRQAPAAQIGQELAK
jgi:tRNA A37 threonylcarbamoyladenosine synthetase subunit TsaC/SUA5/YrdC